ncbi:MAG TPA: DNA/RNA non-specific endonuclease [Myxococcaceae bacterium]|nr:DNA/RNA non-specific endonuclease [Myxococcaceae bacterium]
MSIIWKGKTLDDHCLLLTSTGLTRLRSRLGYQPVLEERVRREGRHEPGRAIVRVLSWLAPRAVHVRTTRSPLSGGRLHLFEAQDAEGVLYQLRAHSLGPTHSLLVAVHAQPQLDWQYKPKTPPMRLEELRKKGLVTAIERDKPNTFKTAPKHPNKYRHTHNYANRTYHARGDQDNPKDTRVRKISGPLQLTNVRRSSTMKVPYKRKRDHSGHLFGHVLGGPPRFGANYVAMSKDVNLGDWKRMEKYLQSRIRQKGTKGWMSVRPQYPGKNKRPDIIDVTAKFNKSPYEVKFRIPTP